MNSRPNGPDDTENDRRICKQLAAALPKSPNAKQGRLVFRRAHLHLESSCFAAVGDKIVEYVNPTWLKSNRRIARHFRFYSRCKNEG